ncbi:DnaD/phage-associated family protein [Natranaerovirga pectinivora]|uniref:DnaD/phage-associated family protein n=1 Tax=Natranaerovirga pectinivora TaxID=682400 RepID=A0A4R3MGH3_9FIRM|nr:DnaD domain protein [Natranaerovirga pectinivora]TCT13065.1 DnaD/phage-associated family protein [Natranaerovirga pectinivora]
MHKIVLDSGQYNLYTSVSNIFIDHYMSSANGDFIKVYLYILRSMQNNTEISTSLIADNLNLTEADVLRALRYWNDLNILKVEGTDKEINKISILQLGNLQHSPTIETINQMDTDSVELIPNEKPEYKPSEMNKFAENASFKQLIYITQKYLGKLLTQNELSTLISFYDWLKLPFEVIEFLIEYCVSNNNRSMRYIEKVAITWSENNIDTLEKARNHIQVFSKSYFGIMKAFGLGNRNPAVTEIQYMKKWLETYKFELDIILEACNRTIQAIHQPSFDYADSILSAWHKKNVRNFNDITLLDDQFEKNKKTRPETKKESKFVNYSQRDYNFDELEKMARERLIKKASESR